MNRQAEIDALRARIRDLESQIAELERNRSAQAAKKSSKTRA